MLNLIARIMIWSPQMRITLNCWWKKKRDTQIVVKPNLFNKITKSLWYATVWTLFWAYLKKIKKCITFGIWISYILHFVFLLKFTLIIGEFMKFKFGQLCRNCEAPLFLFLSFHHSLPFKCGKSQHLLEY
jgi:hypothetical protein